MTERMASGWMTVWRLDTGAKAIQGKTQSRIIANNEVQRGIIARKQ